MSLSHDELCARAAAAMGWALGGQGKELDVDGQRFLQTPGAPARFCVPVSWGLGPPGGGQIPLPLGFNEEDLPAAVALATLATLRPGRGGQNMSPTCGKVLLFMLATGRQLCGLRLRDLARLVYPDATKRLEPSKHLAEVQKALWLAKAAHLLVGNVAIPLFEVAAPFGDPPKPNALPSWKLSDRMQIETARGGGAGRGATAELDSAVEPGQPPRRRAADLCARDGLVEQGQDCGGHAAGRA